MVLEVVVVKTPILLGYETLCPNFGRVYIRSYRVLISHRSETQGYNCSGRGPNIKNNNVINANWYDFI